MWLVAAALAGVLHHRGRIMDVDGPPTGARDLRVQMWSEETGGQLLWEEVRTVFVDRGYYQLNLGSRTRPFPEALFRRRTWLSVAVDDRPLVSGQPLTDARSIVIAQDVSGSMIDDMKSVQATHQGLLRSLVTDAIEEDAYGMVVFQRVALDEAFVPLGPVGDGAAQQAALAGLKEAHGREWLWPFAAAWLADLGHDVSSCDVTVAGFADGFFRNTDAGNYGCIDTFHRQQSTLGTDVSVGIRRAHQEFERRESEAVKAMIVVSDGWENNSADYAAAMEAADAAWDSDIHIWTVTVDNPDIEPDFAHMNDLTRGFGSAWLAPDAQELDRILDEIIAAIPVFEYVEAD